MRLRLQKRGPDAINRLPNGTCFDHLNVQNLHPLWCTRVKAGMPIAFQPPFTSEVTDGRPQPNQDDTNHRHFVACSFAVTPHTSCKLRLLKLERTKDYLLMEQEFIQNQERLKPQDAKNEVLQRLCACTRAREPSCFVWFVSVFWVSSSACDRLATSLACGSELERHYSPPEVGVVTSIAALRLECCAVFSPLSRKY